MHSYPRFIVVRSANGYSYLLQDEQSNVILSGNLWPSAPMCASEIRQVKMLAGKRGLYTKIRCGDGQHSFILSNKRKASIGHGASWWSPSGRDYAMMVVSREAPGALVEDATGEAAVVVY